MIPAKPLTPLHMQTMPNEGGAVQATEVGGGASGGGGAGNKSSEGQMYRDLSSGGIHGTPYNKVNLYSVNLSCLHSVSDF